MPAGRPKKGVLRPPRLTIANAKLAKAHAIAERSLAAYTKLVWPLINPGTPLSWSWHHDIICEALESVTAGYVKRLILNLPPGYTKTTIVGETWSTWPAEFCEHPERRWIYASHSRDLTRAHNVVRRSIIESPWYSTAFAPSAAASVETSQNTQGFFKTAAEGWHMASSVRSKVTGWHGDRQVIDDPLDAGGIWTAELDAVTEWWDSKFKSRLRDGGAVVLIMQRLHARDLTGHFLSPEGSADGEWLHVCLPERFEPKRRCHVSFALPDGYEPPEHWRQIEIEAERAVVRDRRTIPGEVLDPRRFPEERVTKLWAGMSPAVKQAQRQQDPQLGETTFFPAALWRFWHLDPVRVAALNALAEDENPDWPRVVLRPPLEDLALACAWDTTFEAGKKNDYCVALMGGRQEALVYLLAEVRERMDLVRAEKVLEEMVVRFSGCRVWLLEKAANGPGIVSRYRKKVSGLRLVGVSGESKAQRAESATPPVHARQVLLPHPEIAPWVHDFISEMEAFPRGLYDDRVDAFAHLLRYFMSAMGRVELPKPPARPEPELPRVISISPDGEMATPGLIPPNVALARLDRKLSRERARLQREERRARKAGTPAPRSTRWTSADDPLAQ